MTTVAGVYIGIVIMGAMIVVSTALLIMKSISKKASAQSEKQPVEYVDTLAAPKKRPAPTLGLVLDRLKFLLGLSLSRFSRQRRDAVPDQQPIDQEVAANERFSIPLPGAANSEAEIAAVPSPLAEGVANVEPVNVEPVNVEEPEVNMVNSLTAEPNQEAPNVELINEEEPEANMIDSYTAESAQLTQEQLEPTEDEPEEMDEASDNDYQEQPTKEDAVLDLFADEIVEESNISRFAESLDNIDAHDLLEEAQTLMNRLRGGRGQC